MLEQVAQRPLLNGTPGTSPPPKNTQSSIRLLMLTVTNPLSIAKWRVQPQTNHGGMAQAERACVAASHTDPLPSQPHWVPQNKKHQQPSTLYMPSFSGSLPCHDPLRDRAASSSSGGDHSPCLRVSARWRRCMEARQANTLAHRSGNKYSGASRRWTSNPSTGLWLEQQQPRFLYRLFPPSLLFSFDFIAPPC